MPVRGVLRGAEMNERIENLMLEATKDMPQGYYVPGQYFQKFAELIVRDCIAIVEPSSYRRAYPDNYRGGIDCMDTLDDRVEKIKEHFGVKE